MRYLALALLLAGCITPWKNLSQADAEGGACPHADDRSTYSTRSASWLKCTWRCARITMDDGRVVGPGRIAISYRNGQVHDVYTSDCPSH